ncbi:MAG: hypothetical protein IJ057_11035 [Bacteroidales bacterium]|nr:hypothetical protein [Bacteroidales bacterium]
MKRWFPIVFLSCMLAFSACNHPVETQNVTSPTYVDPALQAIDSLMWQRPASALAVLLDYWTCRDAKSCVSTTYNDHYAQLLLAELLYKNDYGQDNRTELRQTVAYFDSLLALADTCGVGRARQRCGGMQGIFEGVGNLSSRASRSFRQIIFGFLQQIRFVVKPHCLDTR